MKLRLQWLRTHCLSSLHMLLHHDGYKSPGSTAGAVQNVCQAASVPGGNAAMLHADGTAALAHAWRSVASTLQSLMTGTSPPPQMRMTKTKKEAMVRKERRARMGRRVMGKGLMNRRVCKLLVMTAVVTAVRQARQRAAVTGNQGLCCPRT
jgi:hypothetical protein